jgi:ABC-2 type transport system permease protein
MPIHDQGYRRYSGGRAPRGQAWSVITRAGLRTLLAKRIFLALLLMAWTPFLFRAVMIYAAYGAASIPQASAYLRPTAETFRGLLGPGGIEGVLIFLITVYVGSGLIANDRRANALQIYLSKPLSRAEYIFGKLAILMTFLLLVTWVPAMVLLAVQIAFSGSFTFLRSNLFLFPAITAYAFIEAALVAFAMLALSSLSKSARYVAVLYAALIFFPSAIYLVLYAVTRSSGFSWLSLRADLDQVGNVIFRLQPGYDTPWPVALLVIVATIAGSALVLERRVRGVEVVA